MGSIRNLTSGKLLKQTIGNHKYLVVNLGRYEDGRRINNVLCVHRIVAIAFLPNPDNKRCVDHINTVRTDNRVDNLRWVTHKENNANPLTFAKMLQSHKTTAYLEKIHSQQRKEIYRSEDFKRRCRECNIEYMRPVICVETGEVWESMHAASRALNVSLSRIACSCRRSAKGTKMLTKMNGVLVHHYQYYKPETSNQENKN